MAGPSSRHRGFWFDIANGDLEVYNDSTTRELAVSSGGGFTVDRGGLTVTAGSSTLQTTDIADGETLYVGVRATPGSNAGINWIGIEDGADDPSGTLTNSLALYTPDAGDSLDFLHADGTTDSLGT